jgi:hypothetical protein
MSDFEGSCDARGGHQSCAEPGAVEPAVNCAVL